jgi:hypothetical protein
MADAADQSGFSLRLPGFSEEPIRFTRTYWNARRTLRLVWSLLTLGVLITIIGAPRAPVLDWCTPRVHTHTHTHCVHLPRVVL